MDTGHVLTADFSAYSEQWYKNIFLKNPNRMYTSKLCAMLFFGISPNGP